MTLGHNRTRLMFNVFNRLGELNNDRGDHHCQNIKKIVKVWLDCRKLLLMIPGALFDHISPGKQTSQLTYLLYFGARQQKLLHKTDRNANNKGRRGFMMIDSCDGVGISLLVL